MRESNRTKLSKKFGITPVPIYIRCEKCNSSCIYCPNFEGISKSYTPNDDTLRAKYFNYSAKKQIQFWIDKINRNFNPSKPIKLEIIILGGTFSDIGFGYRNTFFKELFDGLNCESSSSLEEAQLKNQYAKYRACVITVENRPDNITQTECERLLYLGVSKVELGIQTIYDDVLNLIGRPYNFNIIKRAVDLLRNNGFKIGFHLMINLPFSSIERDTDMLNSVNSDTNIIPDYLKIYPCSLLKSRKSQMRLWTLYETGKWKPFKIDHIVEILYNFKKSISPTVRIQRIQRQFQNSDYLYSKISLRNLVKKIMDESNISCNCLRCQELKTYNSNLLINNKKEVSLNRIKIDNKNIFFNIKYNEYLVGYLRLYLNGKAIIREIKTIGESSLIGETSAIQGQGFGKLLLNHAENYAMNLGFNKIYVICSPGVRNFFIKNSYAPDGYYMSNCLS